MENNGAGSKLKNTRKLPLKRTKKQKLVGKKKTQYSSEIDEEELNQRTFEVSPNCCVKYILIADY